MNSYDEPIYRLDVYVDGVGEEMRVWGPRSTLGPVFQAYQAGSLVTGHACIDGHTNTPDRASLSVAFPWENCRAMRLVQDY